MPIASQFTLHSSASTFEQTSTKALSSDDLFGSFPPSSAPHPHQVIHRITPFCALTNSSQVYGMSGYTTGPTANLSPSRDQTVRIACSNGVSLDVFCLPSKRSLRRRKSRPTKNNSSLSTEGPFTVKKEKSQSEDGPRCPASLYSVTEEQLLGKSRAANPLSGRADKTPSEFTQ